MAKLENWNQKAVEKNLLDILDRQEYELRLRDRSALVASLPLALIPHGTDSPKIEAVLRRIFELALEDRSDQYLRAAKEYVGWTSRSYAEVRQIAVDAKGDDRRKGEYTGWLPPPPSEPAEDERKLHRLLKSPVIRRLLAARELYEEPTSARTVKDTYGTPIGDALASAIHAILEDDAKVQQVAAELNLPEPDVTVQEDHKKLRPKVVLGAGVAVVVLAALTVLVTALVSPTSTSSAPPTTSVVPNAAQIEALYDGKNAHPLKDEDPECADGKVPTSIPAPSTHPEVFGPDGNPVGDIELRTSAVCPVIWARVLWDGKEDGHYRIPDDWTLHVVMHRPATKTAIDTPEPDPGAPDSAEGTTHATIPFAYSHMITTVRGCVYAEVYFSNGSQRTSSAITNCVDREVK